MIAWIAKVQEGDFIGGISAMNDMLEMYPRDKHLLYLAGNWLMGENGNDQAQRFLIRLSHRQELSCSTQRSGLCGRTSPEFDKAFAAMERYIALLPKEPNPQDSYGELMRMSGNSKLAPALSAALKLDPDFVSSQLGLGDTYALMGNQEQARAEYDKAIRFAHNEADRLTYSMQKAMTFVREGNFAEADKQFTEIAETRTPRRRDCRKRSPSSPSRISVRRQPRPRDLKLAEDALHHQSFCWHSDRDEETSRICVSDRARRPRRQ